MTYALRVDVVVQAVWDALPQAVSEQLTEGLAAACEDPIDATVPYGEDDGVMRMLIGDDVFAVIYLGHESKTLHVFQIDYTG